MFPNIPPELVFPPKSPVPNPPKELKIFPLLFGVLARPTRLDNNPELLLFPPTKLLKILLFCPAKLPI